MATRPLGKYRRCLDGRLEAHITKLACSAPREGRSRWTLKLLADKVVELELVDSLSYETVRRTPNKGLKPWRKSMWCIPPEQDAAFVARMERVLPVYSRRFDAGDGRPCRRRSAGAADATPATIP